MRSIKSQDWYKLNKANRRIAELEAENKRLVDCLTEAQGYHYALQEQRDRLADTLRYLKICRTFAVIHSVIDEALASLDKE